MKRIFWLSLALVLFLGPLAFADGMIIPLPPRPGDPFPPNLSIKYHHVDIKIDNQVAQTSVDQVFINNYYRDLEGTYIFPIPEDASISKFSMYIGNEEIKGKILDKAEARQTYEEIVRRKRDPALLEYFKDGMFKASVYPIPANGETQIKLYYSEVLKAEGGICGYRYTLNTEKFSKDPLESVKVTVELNSQQPIKSIYSPSHDIKIEKDNDHHAKITYVEENTRPDKDFLLYYTVSEKDIGLNLLPFEDQDHQGYFMALISPQVEVPADRTLSKNLIFILDTSGSMAGEKIKQTKEALKFCLNSLSSGDRFNVIDFSDQINNFKPGLVGASAENVHEALAFVDKFEAEGGTDINDALLTGFKQTEGQERSTQIIFLTDGLPTVGETDITNIIHNVEKANANKTRLFVFGAGYDVNTRLLDRLADDNHGTSDYVRPSEDIEVKVGNLYGRISHPILTNVKLNFGSVEAFDIYPQELPDIFKGSQMVVVGKYKNGGPTEVKLTGSAGDTPYTSTYHANFSSDDRYDFIPRLWATRRIGHLTDEIRLHGENKELVEEIVRLSKRYGIISEYTSFLVGADYRQTADVLAPQAGFIMKDKMREEVGAGAVNRSQALKMYSNAQAIPQGYVDSEGKKQNPTGVVQTGNRAFFNKNGLWVDTEFEGKSEPVKIQRFSDAYFKLLDRAPEVGKYYALGDEVIFLLNGKAIQIADEGKTDLTPAELNTLISP
jgi:Ca-activated chloride channel family protein